MIKAVLSTTVLPIDGTYRIETVDVSSVDLAGVPHYIGHPDTKVLAEELGAVQAESKLFAGLLVGEQAVCLPIKQGQSNRVFDGHSAPHQNVSIENIDIWVITRIE